jgi:AcrR family transcriptional regulator
MPAPTSARPTPRARRRLARREAILDAAMRIVVEEGPRGLQMRQLATELELSPGAVYRYFDGKDAIIAALGHRILGRYGAAMDDREARSRAHGRSLPPETAALHGVLARAWSYFSLSMGDPGAWRLVNLFLVDKHQLITGEAHDRFMAAVAAQVGRVGALLDDAVAAGALRPGPGLPRALAIVGTLNGHLQFLKMAEQSTAPFEPGQILRLALSTLLIGWGADPGRIAAAWAHHDTLPPDTVLGSEE